MIPPSFYRISVKGIVVAGDKLLLTREDNGKWELLGGGLEYEEAPISGLQREISEETGLVVTHVSQTPKYFITTQRSSNQTYMANVIYEIKLANLDFRPSDECQALGFFSVQEARQLPLFPNVSKLLDVFDPDLHRDELISLLD